MDLTHSIEDFFENQPEVSEELSQFGIPEELNQLNLSEKLNQLEVPGKLCECEHDEFHENLYNASQQSKLTDIILQADDIKIPAHKIVLALDSGYFATMFKSNFKEHNQNEIKINGVAGEILKDVIEFIYTRKILLHKNNIVSMMSAASLFQCRNLEKICCKFLQKNINNCNCLKIKLIAKRFSYVELEKKSNEYALKNYEEISKQQQFLDLEYEDLLDLLKNENLIVFNQTYLFESIVSWLQHDWHERDKYTPSLLKLVKLSSLSSAYLSHRACKLFGHNHECLLLITSALADINSLDTWDKLDLVAFTQRNSLWIIGKNSDKLTIANYNPCVSSRSEIILDNDIFDGVSSENIIFASNKLLANDESKFCLFDLTTKKSQKVSFKTSSNNYYPSLAFIEHDKDDYHVYHILATGIMTRWSSKSNSWETMQSRPSRRYCCGTVVVDNKIYVIGGFKTDNGTAARDVEVYDIVTNTWNTCQPMNEEKACFRTIAFGKFIYVVGGYNTCSVLRYDIENNTWSCVAPLNNIRIWPSVCCYQDKLVVIGGQSASNKWLNTGEEYDLENDKWLPFEPMTSILSYPLAFVYP